MKTKFAFSLIISLIFLAGCAHVEPVRLTAAQVRCLQQREFETTKRVAFPSVVSVLQDFGYIVNSAEINTGFIAATSPCNSIKDWEQNINTSITKVTAFVEEFSPGKVTIRLSFLEVKEVQLAAQGQISVQENLIYDQGLYDEIFEEIAYVLFTKMRASN